MVFSVVILLSFLICRTHSLSISLLKSSSHSFKAQIFQHVIEQRNSFILQASSGQQRQKEQSAAKSNASIKLLKSIITAPISLSISTLGLLRDSFYVAFDTIEATPSFTSNVINNVQNIPEELSQLQQSVSNTTQSIDINAPVNTIFNTIESVSAKRDLFVDTVEIEKSKLKYTLKAPQRFVKSSLQSVRNTIDTFYELQDKLSSKQSSSSSAKFTEFALQKKIKLKNRENNKNRKDGKSIISTFDDVKEGYYNTIDGVKNTVQISQNVIENTVETFTEAVDVVTNLPTTVKTTQENIQNQVVTWQNDVIKIQENIQEFNRLVWKIVTLQAAKETIQDWQVQYNQFQMKLQSFQQSVTRLFEPKVVEAVEPMPVTKVTTKNSDSNNWNPFQQSSSAEATPAVSAVPDKSSPFAFPSILTQNIQQQSSQQQPQSQKNTNTPKKTKKAESNVAVDTAVTVFKITTTSVSTIGSGINWLTKTRKQRELEQQQSSPFASATQSKPSPSAKDAKYSLPSNNIGSSIFGGVKSVGKSTTAVFTPATSTATSTKDSKLATPPAVSSTSASVTSTLGSVVATAPVNAAVIINEPVTIASAAAEAKRAVTEAESKIDDSSSISNSISETTKLASNSVTNNKSINYSNVQKSATSVSTDKTVVVVEEEEVIKKNYSPFKSQTPSP